MIKKLLAIIVATAFLFVLVSCTSEPSQNEEEDKIYRKASTDTSNPGYYIGTSPNPSTTFIRGDIMKVKEGHSNKLYYPHTSAYNGTESYWLASPSVYYSGGVINVFYSGLVDGSNYNYSGLGVRPVVSLNSGITVNAEEV